MSYIDDIYERIEVLDYQIDILNRNYSNLIRRNANYNDHLYYNPVYQNYYNNLSDPEDILSNILFERSRRNYDLLRNRNRNRNSTSTTNNYSQPLYSRNIFLNRENTRQSNLNNVSNNNSRTQNSNLNNDESSTNDPRTPNNLNNNDQRPINENNTPNNSFNENFATNFAQRIHNIFRNIGNNEEINILPNIQIETHTQIIVSHKSVSNNTKIEVFKENEHSESTQNQNNSNIDTESTQNQNNSNEDSESTQNQNNSNIDTESTQNQNNSNIDTESTQNQNQSNESNHNIQNLDNRCVICMENIQEGDIIRKLNKCNHFFHISCIDKWFESKITCPTCRQDIRSLPNVNVSSESDS